jgi:uncharacterized protein (DUF3084 family)
VLIGLLLLALIAGCGGSETQLEKVEGEFKTVRAENEKLEDVREKKTDEYFKASEAAEKLNEAQLEAVSSGDMNLYRQQKAAAAAANEHSEQLYSESQEVQGAPEKLRSREAALENEIEGLKGCDEGCQAARDKAVNLSVHCTTTMAKASVSIKQAIEICDEKYPIPRQNILHLEGE